MEPRAYTEEEVTDEIVNYVKHIVRYWVHDVEGQSLEQKCEGVAFSILTMLDGCSGSLPAFDLVLHPHETDKEFHQSEGENWYENGMVISTMLHERFFK